MTHAEMDELYELYVLGVLEPELARDIDEHLRDGCQYCLERLQNAAFLTAGIASAVEPKKPPQDLEQRILAAVKPSQNKSWIYAAIAASALCVALLAYSLIAGAHERKLREQVAQLTHDRNELRTAVSILSRSQTRTVQFGVAENAPHGRVFLNPSGGVVFVGSNLPQLQSDRAFELWVIPAHGAPRPAGVFRENVSGTFVDVAPSTVNTSGAQAVAVTIEPLAGSAAPTTKPFLIVPLG